MSDPRPDDAYAVKRERLTTLHSLLKEAKEKAFALLVAAGDGDLEVVHGDENSDRLDDVEEAAEAATRLMAQIEEES